MLIYTAWLWLTVVFIVLWVVNVLITLLDLKFEWFRELGYDHDVKALRVANRTHNVERLGGVKEYDKVRYRKAMTVGVVHAAIGTFLLTGVLFLLNWLIWL